MSIILFLVITYIVVMIILPLVKTTGDFGMTQVYTPPFKRHLPCAEGEHTYVRVEHEIIRPSLLSGAVAVRSTASREECSACVMVKKFDQFGPTTEVKELSLTSKQYEDFDKNGCLILSKNPGIIVEDESSEEES